MVENFEIMNFENLSTVKRVQLPLKPAALRIYQSIFPGCRIEDLRENGIKVHILDKEFAIDSLLYVESGQWFSLQEKYRKIQDWHYHDFTQEFENGDGTDGEWFKLGAQLYFFGWGDPNVPMFYEWFILSIPTYKILVERYGGIKKIGPIRENYIHGKAKFTCINFEKIRPAILYFGTDYVFLKRLSDSTFSEPKLIKE